MQENKIIFEDYNIEFTDADYEGVDKKTLIKCKERLEKAIKIAENKGEE